MTPSAPPAAPPPTMPLRRALIYIAPYRGMAAGALTSLLVASAASLTTPRLMEWAVDAGIRASNTRVIAWASAGLVLIALCRGAFQFLQGYWSEAVSQGVAYDMRNAVYDKLQRLSFSYHDRAQTGQLLTRVTSDVEVVRQFVGVGFLQFIFAVVMIGGSTILLVRLDWQLAIAALSVIPAIALVLARFVMSIRPVFTVIQQRLGGLNTVLQENIAGARVIRGFGAERYQHARFSDANSALLDVNLRLIRSFALNFPLVFFFANVGTLLVFWLGGLRVISGELTVGRLVAFNTYLMLLLMPLFVLGGLAAMISRAGASAARVFEVIDAVSDVQDAPDARELGDVEGRVAFKDVRFRYVGAAEEALAGVSFVIEPGQTVALVGPTGSGKSTIVNLIPRFYDVASGQVSIDGIDVRQVTLASLRRQIGLVLQDPTLFAGTIRDNIAYGRPGASDAEVHAAAAAAQAEEFIGALPLGYESPVGERGVGLSGGQKQRIAIARALLVDPRILILDDSTSAVDAETEYAFRMALEPLLKSRTAIIIAQRVSTVRLADRILVLEGGRLVADGTHDDLLFTSPLYGELVGTQLLDDVAMAIAT